MDSSPNNEEELAVVLAMHAVFVTVQAFHNMMTAAVAFMIEGGLLESDEEDSYTMIEEIPSQAEELDGSNIDSESSSCIEILKKKGPKTRKRKRVNEKIREDLNKNLEKGSKAIQRVAKSLEAILVECTAQENDRRKKREQLDELIEPLGLPLKDRMYVVRYFAMKPPLLDVFHGFKSDEERLVMVNLILQRRL